MNIGERKLGGAETDQSREEKFSEILAMGESERDRYFSEIAGQYDQGMPIADSIVRLDQERAIAEDLKEGQPVLIRGVWRTGKTSMTLSIRNHIYRGENCIFESVDIYGVEDDIKKTLGLREVIEIVAGPDSSSGEEKKVKEEISRSGKTPLEYLNDYLVAKNEKVFVSLDEVIAFRRDPEKLKFLARLKDLSHVHLAVVLHHVAEAEEDFAEIFKGFKTHYVRPLTVEEVGMLVRRPLEGKPIDFTDEAVERIFEITGGRPLEINNICYGLFSPFFMNKNKKWKARYEAADIEKFVAAAKEEHGGVFGVTLRNYEKVYKMACGKDERKIIDRLIDEGEISSGDTDLDQEAMQTLVNLSFVRQDKNTGAYVINGTLFAERIEELRKENK